MRLKAAWRTWLGGRWLGVGDEEASAWGKGKEGKVSELVHQAAWVHVLKFKFRQHRAITITQAASIYPSLCSGCSKPAPGFTLAIGQSALPS